MWDLTEPFESSQAGEAAAGEALMYLPGISSQLLSCFIVSAQLASAWGGVFWDRDTMLPGV